MILLTLRYTQQNCGTIMSRTRSLLFWAHLFLLFTGIVPACSCPKATCRRKQAPVHAEQTSLHLYLRFLPVMVRMSPYPRDFSGARARCREVAGAGRVPGWTSDWSISTSPTSML